MNIFSEQVLLEVYWVYYKIGKRWFRSNRSGVNEKKNTKYRNIKYDLENISTILLLIYGGNQHN